MPNWCFNEIKITGNAANIKKMADEIAEKDKDGNFISILERSIIDHPYINLEINNDTYAIAKIEDIGKYSISKPYNQLESIPDGYALFDWYEWQSDNYGAKWGFCDEHVCSYILNEDEDTGVFEFIANTAWGPANGLVSAICKKFKVNAVVISEQEDCDEYDTSNFVYDKDTDTVNEG